MFKQAWRRELGRLIKANILAPYVPRIQFEEFPDQPLTIVENEREDSPEYQLERAKSEAETTLHFARMRAEAILEEAREYGYNTGREAGLAEARATVDPLIQRLEQDLADVKAEAQEFMNALEPQLLKLCLETVEKVIRHEIKTNPQVVIRIVKSCLRKVRESHEIRVRVNPSEVEIVRAHRNELLGAAEGVDAINILDDRKITPGGCIIETATGDFDATLETQLEKIENTLTETFENDRSQTSPEPGEIPASNQPHGYGPG